jgi:site-specific recombinase XerD
MLEIRRKNLRWVDIDMATLNLDKLIVHYSLTNKAEGKSPKTIAWYNEMLNGFVKYLISTSRNAVLDEFNMATVREFIVHEQNRPVSPYTVQAKARALKAFSSWLQAEDYTSQNLLSNLKLPKVPVKVIEPLTESEINTLISAQNPLTALGSRNIAILVTLLATGLRLSELCNLQFGDAHVEEDYLKVLGKGNKERLVPIGSLGRKILWRYIFHFRPQPLNEKHDYLFLSLDAKKLSPNAVKLLLKRWGKRTGVPRLHAHLCRHSYATNFLNYRCGDVFHLKQILGHSSLEMTNKYVHYASVQVMLEGHVSSPMDHLEVKGLRGYKIDRVLRNRHSFDS